MSLASGASKIAMTTSGVRRSPVTRGDDLRIADIRAAGHTITTLVARGRGAFDSDLAIQPVGKSCGFGSYGHITTTAWCRIRSGRQPSRMY